MLEVVLEAREDGSDREREWGGSGAERGEAEGSEDAGGWTGWRLAEVSSITDNTDAARRCVRFGGFGECFGDWKGWERRTGRRQVAPCSARFAFAIRGQGTRFG